MRIFKNFDEARGEIKRDLKEMGITVKGTMMQDKEGDFPTLELFNYGYQVLNPLIVDLCPTPEWCSQEWLDRLSGINGVTLNPGAAWQKRKDNKIDWSLFLEFEGKPIHAALDKRALQIHNLFDLSDPKSFSYTYSERLGLNDQVWKVIRELRRNPESRQLYVTLWDPHTDPDRLGIRRVPCSLGWHFLYREGETAGVKKLHITYTMRSCDFVTHWENDCWLTLQLLKFVASKCQIESGTYSQFINSFHVYSKNVIDVF